MIRTYELVFIVDPRLSDEEVVSLTEEYKAMITAADGKITKEESWGRKKLAYPIRKLNEGKYVLLYIEAKTSPCVEVEQRMRQNEKILRYLTTRTDQDLKRAASKGKKPRAPRPDDSLVCIQSGSPLQHPAPSAGAGYVLRSSRAFFSEPPSPRRPCFTGRTRVACVKCA